MTIATYADLSTAVSNWLGRAHLIERIPDFIALSEARFRRRLEGQLTSATINIANGVATLPSDFGGFESVADSTIGRVEYVSPSQFADYDATEAGTFPVLFTVIGTQIMTLPASTGSLAVVYKPDLPALSATNTSNWLLARAPDLYLFSALLQAEFYGWNDERLPLIKAAVDEMLAEMCVDNEHRRFGPSPVGPRIART